jgi:tetratricopeptide (TPR) repeat protein
VARLMVFRGETLDREIEVGRETFRIGRGDQNDLVLEDRGKAVSRNHAEIRYEGGRYVLADLDSQNGIWVAGNRVPFVVLDPKVVASVGPYRLMLEVEPPTDAAFVIPEGAALDSNDYAELAKTQVRPAEPIGRTTPKPPAPAPVTAGPKTPVPKAVVPKPPLKAPASAKGQGPATTKWLAIGGAAVLVLVLAIVIVRIVRRPPAVVDETGPKVMGMIADARRLIEQGDCAGALTRAIEPALSLDPANAEAQMLKTQATACTPPSQPPPPPPPDPLTPEQIAEHLQVANDAIGRQECEAALTEHINKVLAQEPANPQAVELQQKAQVCPPPVVAKAQPAGPPPVKPLVRIAPENGGLEPTAGELEKDYQARMRAMRTRYDEAVGTLANESHARAITALEGIARDAGNRYLDVASKLSEARKGVAQQVAVEARDFEAKNEYDQAIAAFRRVGTLDHDAKVDEDIRRVQEKKMQAGLKACDEGKNAFAFNRGQQALQFYQQVIKLLPDSHPCFATAKERIATLSR